MNPVLTTQIKNGDPKWSERVEILPGWPEHVRQFWKKPKGPTLWTEIRWGVRLFAASRRYPAVITGSERCALIFAVLQTSLRRRKVPHIMIECLWDVPEPSVARLFKKYWLHLVMISASRIIVHTSRQISEYERLFGKRNSCKFVFLPCHTTLYDKHYESVDGEYIFSGGDSKRDYATLIEAAKHLPYEVVIAAHSDEHFMGLTIPPNVRIITGGISFDEFYQLVAAAGLVVVPVKPGRRYPGGQQVYLNAMAIGKSVIVADEFGVEEYIENGQNGIIVPPSNAAALCEAIFREMQDRASSRAMAARAKATAERYCPEAFFDRVFEIVDSVTASGNPRSAISSSLRGLKIFGSAPKN